MKILELKYTVSKAQDSYGYNVITLIDRETKYRTCGGGYDMIGTVFAKWLWANYKDEIIRCCAPYECKDADGIEYYGYFNRNGHQYLDGACGIDCIIRIAKSIGLSVERYYNKHTQKLFIVKELCNAKNEE